MTASRTNERGEGKVGCIMTLLVLGAAVAAGIKAFPVYYANNSLQNFAEETAPKAALYPPKALELQMRDKVKELNIPEALAPGAITVTVSGDKSAGNCTITLNYSTVIDFYGLTSYKWETRSTIIKPYMDSR